LEKSIFSEKARIGNKKNRGDLFWLMIILSDYGVGELWL
jgi:hypothetical protein